jgi:hypothetical protein
VVGGLVDAALMPKLNPAINDHKPVIATHVVDVLHQLLAGKDVGREFGADAGYTFNATDAADMRSLLPARWDATPLRLLKRTEQDGAVQSVYRLGPQGDTRVMLLDLDAKGKLENLVVKADPDNR